MKIKQRRRVGRPAAGPEGQKRTEMRHQITARIPDDKYALLRALAAALHTSQAEILVRGLAALTETLPPDVRNVVTVLQRQGHKIQQK
jgi:phosphoserine phosphatase